MKVLWTGEIHKDALELLKQNGVDITAFGTQDLVNEKAFAEVIPEHQVYVSGGLENLSKAVIDAGDSLKLAIFLGADPTDYFDLSAARLRNVIVATTPGANAASVAELSVGFCIMAARKIPHFSTYLSNANWSPETVHALYGSKISILGMGHIGTRVARVLRSLGCNDLVYWSRSRKRDIEAELGIKHCSFEGAISNSDVISLHIPGDAGVLLDHEQMNLMKNGVKIINTARPSLVSASALLDGLKKGIISSAAFDGFYGDGKRDLDPIEQELLTFDKTRLTVTPHIGWRTVEADREMHIIAARQIISLANSKPVDHVFQ
jgi:D-3-phosphoglycerate dehydrogenase